MIDEATPAAALAHWWASFLPITAPQLVAGSTPGAADTWTDLAPIGLLHRAAGHAALTLGNASLPVQSQAVARPSGVLARLGPDGPWLQIWPPLP